MGQVSVTSLRGLGLPAQRGVGGYFNSKTKYDVGFSDLLHAVFTPIGSRPMRRTFGSAVHTVLFEPNTVTTQRVLEQAIRTAVDTFCPHLYVDSVEMRRLQDGISLGIKFGFNDERQIQERTVLVTKSDVARLLSAQRNAP